MKKIQLILTAPEKREFYGVLLLVLIVLVLHLATVMQPAKPVFDEQYYVPSARSILQGTGTGRIEQPPLGQLFIAAGIRLFGDNPLGWRIFSIIFGLAGIVFLYLICRRLKMPQRYAYLAAFLFSFENLSFIQSGVAMLDVFSLTFMLGAFWLYLKGHYFTGGALAGLAALAKLTGALAIPIIVLHWFIIGRKSQHNHSEEGVVMPSPATFLSGDRNEGILKKFILFIVAAPLTFLLLMPLSDFIIWHKWLNPFSQVATMLHINVYSTFARYPSTMLSRPWDWVLHPVILTYWIDPHYVAMVSPPVWALIIPAVVFIIFKAFKGNAAAIFALVWFTGAYLAWIPFSLISDRISYIYYFYPAIGAICMAISLMEADLVEGKIRISKFYLRKKHRVQNTNHQDKSDGMPENFRGRLIGLIIPVYLLVCLGTFAVLSPVSYWWKVPLCVLAYLVSRYYISRQPSKEIVAFKDNAIIERQEIC